MLMLASNDVRSWSLNTRCANLAHLVPPFPLVKSYKDAANEVLGDVGLVRLLGEVAESEKDNILTCITSMDRQVAFRYAQR